MTQWQKIFTREPPKTKAELREMLTEAVRNTQSSAELLASAELVAEEDSKKVRD